MNLIFILNKVLYLVNLKIELILKIETMSALYHNSHKPFLRNEFSEIFEDLFTLTLLTKTTDINDRTKNLKLKSKSSIR